MTINQIIGNIDLYNDITPVVEEIMNGTVIDDTGNPATPEVLHSRLFSVVKVDFETECWNYAVANNMFDRFAELFPTSEREIPVDPDLVTKLALSIMYNNEDVTVPTNMRNAVDDACWQIASDEDERSYYDRYCKFFPQGNHYGEAQEAISNFPPPPPSPEDERRKIIEDLAHDPNSHTVSDVMRSGIREVPGIPADIMNFVWESNRPNIRIGNLQEDSFGATQFYVWGVKGAGKTSVLASLLSCERSNLSWPAEVKNPKGLGYFNMLRNALPQRGIGWVPDSTVSGCGQYMAMKRAGGGKQAPFVLFDVAGEVIRDMYRIAIGTLENKDIIDRFYTYLHDSNPKFHFFIYDVTSSSLDPEFGVDQDTILQTVSTYFQENDVFKKSRTLGFAIVAAKSDTLAAGGTYLDLSISAANHIQENCGALLNNLGDIARSVRQIGRHDTLPVIPFSIGKVYMQYVCRPNFDSARQLWDTYIYRNI